MLQTTDVCCHSVCRESTGDPELTPELEVMCDMASMMCIQKHYILICQKSANILKAFAYSSVKADLFLFFQKNL